jgi:predicted nucleotidyltransferase component of viral defense system
MSAKAKFDDLAEMASRKDRLDRDRRAIIAHEIVLYDVIFALHRAGLLKDLVMRGGTSLRLCHASRRYSEDLLFAVQAPTPPQQMRERMVEMGAVVEQHTKGRYNLRCQIKDPAEVRREMPKTGASIETWRLTLQAASNLSINLDVQQAQAYTSEAKVAAANYEFLPAGYDSLLLQVQTPGELMADLVTTLADGSDHVRSAEIYDLLHLQQRHHEVALDLLEGKIEDFRTGDFESKLDARIAGLPALIETEAFQDEMRRLLSPERAAETIDNPDFRNRMGREVYLLLTEVRKALYPRPEDDQAARIKI